MPQYCCPNCQGFPAGIANSKHQPSDQTPSALLLPCLQLVGLAEFIFHRQRCFNLGRVLISMYEPAKLHPEKLLESASLLNSSLTDLGYSLQQLEYNYCVKQPLAAGRDLSCLNAHLSLEARVQLAAGIEPMHKQLLGPVIQLRQSSSQHQILFPGVQVFQEVEQALRVTETHLREQALLAAKLFNQWTEEQRLDHTCPLSKPELQGQVDQALSQLMMVADEQQEEDIVWLELGWQLLD